MATSLLELEEQVRRLQGQVSAILAAMTVPNNEPATLQGAGKLAITGKTNRTEIEAFRETFRSLKGQTVR